MSEIDELIKDIEDLRENLYRMIEQKKGNLHNEEVLSASKILNAAITQYNKIIKDKLQR
jgi:Spo0E like sporulation regulatory protein.